MFTWKNILGGMVFGLAFGMLWSRHETEVRVRNRIFGTLAPIKRERSLLAKPLVDKPPKLRDSCRQYLDEIRRIDLDTVLRNPRWEFAAENCGELAPEIKLLYRSVLTSCDSAQEANAQHCYAALLAYRLALAESVTAGIAVAQLDDIGILKDKLLLRFKSDPVDAIEVAERLSELEPRSFFAAKATLIGKLLKAKSSAKPDWEEVKDSLDRARSLAPDEDEREWVEMGAIISAKTGAANLGRLRHEAESLDRTFPEWGTGPYQLAWIENQLGNIAGALRYVREAIRREPGEARYRRTLTRLEQANSIYSDEIFEARTSLVLE